MEDILEGPREWAWNPDVKKLPLVVQRQMDVSLSPIEFRMRQMSKRKALISLVRYKQAKPHTIILYLRTDDGGVEKKPFTFYKTVINP